MLGTSSVPGKVRERVSAYGSSERAEAASACGRACASERADERACGNVSGRPTERLGIHTCDWDVRLSVLASD
ncbi:hypothetical protein CDL15_Pgr015106 [Punica granatum]|nr:hypothetical protein CDL15_Pgr015106 [Punica granatum]